MGRSTSRHSHLKLGAAPAAVAMLVLALCVSRAAEQERPLIDPELLKAVPEQLRGERKPVPDTDNAFIPWQLAVGALVEPEHPVLEEAYEAALSEENLFPGGEQGQRLAEWIGVNRQALDYLDQGIARGNCQFPEVTGPDMAMPYLADMRKLARLKLVRGKMLAGWGDAAQASIEIADVLRMGHMTRHSEDVLITYLVGTAVEGIGLGGARWMADDRDASEPVLKELLKAIEPGRGPDKALALTMRTEFRAFFLSFLSQLDEGGVEAFKLAHGGATDAEVENFRELMAACPKPLDKKATARTAAALFLRHMRNIERPWAERDAQIEGDVKKLADELQGELKPFLDAIGARGAPDKAERARLKEHLATLENPVGKVIIGLVMPAFGRMSKMSFERRAEREATRAVLALRIYELRKKRLPIGLKALLTARILREVPYDPFADAPLRYSRERRLVWSVGPDQKDNGGKGEPNTTRGEDYVFTVP